MKKEINTNVSVFVNAMNHNGTGKLAFDDALENIQVSIYNSVIALGLSNKKTTEIGGILKCVISNAYKAGFVCGANVPELTQNNFIKLMYDKDYKIVGDVIVDDLQSLTGPVKF